MEEQPARILIVDDSLVNLDVLRLCLTGNGYVIHQATNGEEAVQMAADEDFDLILLDVKMPGMDGYTTCQQLKARPHLQHIPVIFVSAAQESPDKLQGFKVGGVDYVTKPIDLDILLARVELHLKINQQQREIAHLREQDRRHIEYLNHEVKQRQAVEVTLREERDLAQQYLAIVGVIILVINPAGEILILNQQGYRTLGYAEGELLGKNWFELCIPNSHRNYVRQVFSQLKAGENASVEQYENPVLTQSGEERLIRWRNVCQYDGEGNLVSVLASGEDITAHKRAEQALAAERQLLRTLIDTLPDYIFVKDRQGRFVVSNLAHALTIPNGTPADFIGKTALELYSPELGEQYHIDDLQVMDTGETLFNAERQTFNADGTYRWVLTTKVPLRNDDGQIMGLVGVSRDITARKQLEQHRLALDLERARGQMLAGFIEDASHEFRTPLAVISSGIELLEMRVDLSAQSSRLDLIKAEIVHIVNLVDGLLNMSNLDSGIEFTVVPIDINCLLDEISGLFDTQLHDKALVLTLDLDNTLPLIQGDKEQLYQAFTYLFDNAVKYTPDGGAIIIQTYLRNNQVVVELQDTGVGISDTDLPYIFDRLYRSLKTRQIRGIGLGLAMAKKIIETHRGYIMVESPPGKGSTFRVALPVNHGDQSQSAAN